MDPWGFAAYSSAYKKVICLICFYFKKMWRDPTLHSSFINFHNRALSTFYFIAEMI